MDLPTRSELFAVGRRSIANAADRRRINPATVDIPGSDLNLLIGAGSLMGEEVVARLAKCLKGLFIDTATDDALDRLAFDRFGLTRKAAAPASVAIVLSRPMPGVATPGIYTAGSRVQTPDGTVFALNTDAVFGDFATSVTVDVTALVAGVESNVAANTLIQFADPPFDTNLTVTNPTGAAGGAEQESDVEFRARVRDFFPTIRRGTEGAIEFGARTVPGVAVATAREILNPFPSNMPAAIVELTVADANGGFSNTMLQQVQDVLLEYRALGIPVIVQGGTLFLQSVVWAIGIETGFNENEVLEDVRAVTVATAQFLAPGATLFRSSLISAARTVPGAVVGSDALVTPAGDTVPETTELIRIRDEDISFV